MPHNSRIGEKMKHFAVEKLAKPVAKMAGLSVYESFESQFVQALKTETAWIVDQREVRDKRSSLFLESGEDLTLTSEGLEDILAGISLEGKSVLEVGPKYGIHSRWIDQHAKPAKITFMGLEQSAKEYDDWSSHIQAPSHWIYGDVSHSPELIGSGPYDLLLFLGVLYHSINHMDMLRTLNASAKPGALMLLETTYDNRPDATLRFTWGDNRKAKAIPSLNALRIMLAWTGWSKVVMFEKYRPGSEQIVLLCEKTHELDPESGFSPLVQPHK
jgi:2-polyprenyl-3-methyl-5-hydroxy-6-metoxy-1,4-benzoquinol methylase